MVVEAKVKKYIVKKQHTVPMSDLGGSPNYGCKHFHMVHFLGEPCRRVHSPMEGLYSPSWTYMH